MVGAAVIALPISTPSVAGAKDGRSSAAPRVIKSAVDRAARVKAIKPRARAAKVSVKRRPSSARAAGASRAARVVPASLMPSATVPNRVSIGQAIGLHLVDDPLDLKSSVALVVDQASGETLFQKNPRAVLPIASITKLMTAMVVLDAGLPLDEVLTITDADRDTERNSSSRMPIGAQLTRREMLQLALMSSENRAASALGRHYPGGIAAFVAAMNQKARELQMVDTRFADATGLSGNNVSNARDLASLVRAAYEYAEIRQFSTSLNLQVEPAPRRVVAYRSTNRLVDAPDWDIGLQKTGYISEAGRCMVMQATVEGRGVIIVLLDAAGSHYRLADAQRIRNWLRTQPRTATGIAKNDQQS